MYDTTFLRITIIPYSIPIPLISSSGRLSEWNQSRLFAKVGSRFVVRLTAQRSCVNLPMVSWPEKHMGFTTDLYNNNKFLAIQQY